MRLSIPGILLLSALTMGCVTPRPVIEPEDDGEVRPAKPTGRALTTSEPVAIPSQFDPGCTALAETEELLGTVEVIPFGKGREGVIIDDGDVKWVVSYDAEGVFADFERQEVLARGRRCEKQGESIKAYHFEVKSVRVVL